MRRSVRFSALFLLTVLMLVNCGKGPKEAEEYNNRLVAIQNNVIKTFIGLGESFSSKDKTKIDAAWAAAQKVTADAVEAVKKEGPFDGDDTFRQKLQALLEFYKSVVDIDYKELVEIIGKYPDLTQEDQQRANDINASVAERERPLDAEYQAVQKAFAEKYNLILKENELQKEIDK